LKKILSRMFRVYAHLYHSHWDKVKALGADAHLNTCFKHFYYFTAEFEMIKEAELQPMASVVSKLRGKDAPPPAADDGAAPAPAADDDNASE
jgi:MOB kinase activator 1